MLHIMEESRENKIIQEIMDIEQINGLNDIYIENNIPLWHILRYRLRGYFFQKNGITDISSGNRKKLSINNLKYFFISFFQYIKILFTKETVKVCFFGFSRLESINGTYIDKFIDPIIYESNLKDSDYLYFNNQYERHSEPRSEAHKIIYVDFINSLSMLIGALLLPFIYIRNANAYNRVINITKKYISKKKKVQLFILLKSASIYIQKVIYLNLFKRLSPSSIVGVSRVTFVPQALAAKQLGIKVIEIQHGITQGPTNLYSGYVNRMVDPDIFCTFGDYCPKNVFGIEEFNIVNIGWAFKSYINSINNVFVKTENAVLVISEPGISEKLLLFIVSLADKYPQIEFHIRRHPQESFNEKQLSIIKESKNIKDVTSTQCSQIAILPYDFIMGENSSVLYESLSMGKNVARINCCGFNAIGYDLNKDDGFYYINSIDNFYGFMHINSRNSKDTIYSDFNRELFIKLIS